MARKDNPTGIKLIDPWVDWLQQQLRRREWRAADFARALNVPNGTVSRWVTGERKPSPESCDRIADLFGVDVDFVLTLAGHRPATEPLKLDDPVTEIVALVKRVQWNDERAEAIKSNLRLYLDFDRRKKNGGTGQ